MKYFKNTSWLFGEKLLRLFVGLIIGVWIARYLGPEQFGLFNYAASFVGLFAIISTLGLDNIVIRELVKDENKRDLIIGTAFYLKLMGAIGVIGIIAIAVNFTSNDTYTNTLVFILASTAIFQSFNVIDFYFQSIVQSRYLVYANVVTLLISSLIKIVLLILEAPLIAFVGVGLFDSFILACGLIYFYNKNFFSFKSWKFDYELALSLLKDSWPLIISGMVVAVYMKIDQVMIKEMLDIEAVGQYAAAVRLSEIWYIIPLVVTSSIFPAIVKAKINNKDDYDSKLQMLYDSMVYLAVGIAIPTFFISDWVVNFFFGKSYYLAGAVLKIHIWTGVFVFLGVASGKWLINENLQRYLMINTAIGALLNIFLNYFLINAIGIVGAAWSSLISYFIASYFCLFFSKKTRINFIHLTKSLFFIRITNVIKSS